MNFKESGKVIFYVGKMSIEVYYPYIWWDTLSYGISFQTIIVGRKYNKLQEWWIVRSFAFKLLGFGLGFAWKHIDNPNTIIKSTD